uniref:Uncharacterized protein n=1 Tax=Sebdenia flabellata TaxID=42024 RepID=A0A1C9C9S6_9FLOR|nr:hypothetical protein Sebd_050 [Sebdenia flabellata]AOM65137.1 hypothetical protein Sebd_050 [Sebdenia flabellata]
MCLLKISLSNQYIYTPITWLHRIKPKNKIYFIFSFLIFLPYQNYSYFMISIILYLSIALTLRIPKKYYNYFIQIVLIIVLYIFFNKAHKINYINKNQIRVFIPLKILGFISNAYFILPEFVLRISLITILYLVVLKMLLWTTTYETILILFFSNKKIKSNNLQKIMLVSSFACQFLEQILLHIRIIMVAVKLRNIHLKVMIHKYIILHYAIAKCLTNIKYDILKISSSLYIRDLDEKNFKIHSI